LANGVTLEKSLDSALLAGRFADALERNWMTQRMGSASSSLATTSNASLEARAAATEGLTAFTPMWGAAMLFSLAGDRNLLMFRNGALLFALTWAAVAVALALIVRPRFTRLLYVLAALMVARYGLLLPVASNNKTITVFMNAAILVCALQAAWTGLRDVELRAVTYDRMRVVARALLAVMYFYGIFHKINTDFFDPRVSCAVALYDPLARGFGLDGHPLGHQIAIWSTFIIETITLVSLYCKRFFAVGLIFGLMFHFVIPISTYSWYMDFSSLVLALYMLSIPREVSAAFFERVARLFRSSRERFGSLGLFLPFAVVAGIAVIIVGVTALRVERLSMLFQVYNSVWVLFWAVYGGIAMVLLTAVALDYLPWRGQHAPRQPLWIYAFPFALFLSCLSPYVGLKTESSIAMFSNLHTEGGETNHLMFATPPYLFGYQQDVVHIVASSSPALQEVAKLGDGMVWLGLQQFLNANPTQWVTFRRDGVLHERATAASLAHLPQPSWLERKFLLFKTVDFDRPKVCTH
jgi:hypothetical protein